ncbi:MAG: right-handed parallel beta-helix repeat-containing protein [Planctomycetes bacterium]|nr:right-handed parallel beta-helix repeat-containing protein [Planctomycetota bacterium]
MSKTRWPFLSVVLSLVLFAALSSLRSLPSLRAETAVRGTVQSSEWTEAGSPYHVTGTVVIPEGLDFKIEAGVVVSFDPGESLVVQGTLAAEGTEARPIVFLPHDAGGTWGGVLFLGKAANGQIDYLELSRATKPSHDGTERAGAFSVVNGARVRLVHAWFHDFGGVVIDSSGGSELVVQDTTIEDSREAIHSANGYALVERTTIRRVTGYSDCIDFDNESTPRSVIRDCVLEDNAEDDGIDLGGSSALVENVVIRGVKAGKAISIDQVCTPTIRNVLVHDCMWGLVVKDKSTPVFDHCTVSRCEVGVKCYNKISGAGGGHGAADSMVIWGNEESVAVDDLSTFDMTHSICGGGYPGEGNLDLDPLFVDPERADFHLREGSPAIGAGKDGTDMGAFPSGAPPPPPPPPPPAPFVRGEANGDGDIDVGDPVALLLVLFRGAAPGCPDALDADDSGNVDVTDAVYLLRFLFLGGPAPPAPFPDPGTDPTEDDPYECKGGG